MQQEVLQLEHGDTELEDLQQLCLEKRQEFEQVALQVRDKRQQLAQQLTEGLLIQLSQLAMGTTRFSVQFIEKAASAQGLVR